MLEEFEEMSEQDVRVLKIALCALEEMACKKLADVKVPSFDYLINQGYGRDVGVTAKEARELIKEKLSDFFIVPK